MLARCGLRAALLGQAFSTTTRAAVTAQALRYHEFGSPESVLKLEKIEVADPKDGEVLVKFKAAPINPADINQIQGVYGIQPKLPAVAGNEGVAVVEKLGANVKGLAIGDRVIPSAPGFGTWTTHAVAPSSSFIKVSSKIPLEYAATLSVNPCTALRLLNDFVALKKGDVIVQNGANSMVGQSVIQLAKQRGITTINVIRQRPGYEQVVKRLKAFGADFVITEDLAASHDFRDVISGLPAPRLALNCVGGKNATEIARLLGNDGVLVTYGGMSKKPVQIPTSLFIFKNIQLKGFWLSQWLKDHSAAERDAMFTELTDLITQDKFRLFVENHRFDQFQQALITNQEQRDRKVVLSFD